MTPHLGGTGKSPKQALRFVQAVSIVVLFLIASEILLLGINKTKTCTSCPSSQHRIPIGESISLSNTPGIIPILATSPTVHEAFDHSVVVHWDNLTQLAPQGLRTYIDTSGGDEARFLRYGMSPLRNVCIRPNGTIVVVGVSEAEFSRSLAAAGQAMAKEWRQTYNCSWGCYGAAFENRTPKDALWIDGHTTHIIPYLGNVFHHFAERVWPHLTGYQDPEVGLGYYYVHRMHTWLEQAHHSLDRNTLMYQIAILGRVGGAKFLQHSEDEARPLCFDRLTLCSAASGRMSGELGLANFARGMARYREAAFELFGITSPPQVSLPPRPLRVTLYGRSDASRRRVTNIAQVADFLRLVTQPPLQVTCIDELMQTGLLNNTLPEVVSLMTQTDMYITPHGANTWATVFMPKRAAVVEICGPCGPGTWISNTVVPALELKHGVDGNPWGERVSSVRAGNTTECRSALETPDFSVDVGKLWQEMQGVLARVSGVGDRLPLYCLFDWETHTYWW